MDKLLKLLLRFPSSRTAVTNRQRSSRKSMRGLHRLAGVLRKKKEERTRLSTVSQCVLIPTISCW